ncbi:hypothetical protein GO986_20505 [Deinococcus sp. HMF7620]|uniref:Uncharacterized protein n=1 Tax=Deinococcus arboris TaxID=2682977 RepID=A0A7C9M932_9DEIO|nr:hypothetical protein [Deinococcus arboris]MVN89125.1 hypothetical protein [Deinococcus arboris]
MVKTRMLMTIGGVALVLGIILNVLMGRRAFMRRNASGVQEFRSYGHSVAAGCLEPLVRLFAFLCIIGGIFLLASGLMLDPPTVGP